MIDVRNPYFTRKIKRLNRTLLELNTLFFMAKIKKPLALGPWQVSYKKNAFSFAL